MKTKIILQKLQKIENILMVIFFTVMLVAVFMQVINRNITKLPVIWLEELARYAMIYMTMFATEVGLRDGTQISVNAVVEKIPKKPRKYVEIAGNLTLTLFTIVVFCYSFPLVKNQLVSGQTSSALGIPMVIPYFALFLGFGVMAMTQSVRVIHKIKELFIKKDDLEVTE